MIRKISTKQLQNKIGLIRHLPVILTRRKKRVAIVIGYKTWLRMAMDLEKKGKLDRYQSVGKCDSCNRWVLKLVGIETENKVMNICSDCFYKVKEELKISGGSVNIVSV